jgi:RNA polymerase sporulation-specific sigma factor
VDENLCLIEKAKAGDKSAEARLVELNMRLVWSVARRFLNRGHELDDLFQIGCIGLLKAISKFDKSFNVKFSTYAVPMVIGEIKRFLRDDGMIKVSRSLKDIYNKARVTSEAMSKELEREPSLSELADRLGVTASELAAAQDSATAPASLQSIWNDQDSGLSLLDKIGDKTDAGGSENEIVDRLALKQVLNCLGPRERQIIILRYFKDKTQTQIASMLGISQVQVSRLEKKILVEIRRILDYV